MTIINLNHKRKAKAREDKQKQAENNRRKFGRTKEEKQLEKARAEKLRKHIDAHKMDSEKE